MSTYEPPSDLESDSDSDAPKKRKKKKKDPNAPKRNMSSYFLYSNATRNDVKAANPEAKFGEIAQIISRHFKALPEEERAYWDQKAVEDKERYQTAMAAYKPTLGAASGTTGKFELSDIVTFMETKFNYNAPYSSRDSLFIQNYHSEYTKSGWYSGGRDGGQVKDPLANLQGPKDLHKPKWLVDIGPKFVNAINEMNEKDKKEFVQSK